MDELIKKLASDEATQKKFVEFAHTREEEVKEVSKQVSEDLNKFVIDSIFEYAKQNNIELTDDAEAKEKASELCKKVSSDFQAQLIEMFNKSFINS